MNFCYNLHQVRIFFITVLEMEEKPPNPINNTASQYGVLIA